MTDFNLIPLLPEIFLTLIGLGLMLVGVQQGDHTTRVISWAVAVGFAIAGLLLLGLDWDTRSVLNGMFVFDKFAGFVKLLILIGLITSIALSVQYLMQEGIERSEFPILVLFAGVGMMLMVSSNNFLALYVGFELQCVSFYALTAFHRNSVRSSEAGIKFFMLGLLSSGMLLFGISLIYGFTGSLDFAVIHSTLNGLESVPIGVTFGLVFILAALGFKVSAVPFHMWAPDVYQGAPSAVTALLMMVPKIAAIALLMRLLFDPFSAMQDQWVQIIYFMSVMSMIIGAFAMIAQDNIKRLLAFSAIGNAGFALMGLVAGTPEGAGAVVLYFMIHMVMTAGIFAVVISMRRQQMAVFQIRDLSGLSKSSPGLAYAMAILMFSMIGMPPTAGFFGKFIIFNAVVAQGHYILAIVGVLTSIIAAYAYLNVVKVMFFDEVDSPFDKELPFARRAVLFIAILFVLAFIVKPSLFIASALDAASVLFAG